MFTWLNKQGVKSDMGFTVQSVSRFVIRYSETQGEIDLSVEDGKYGGKAMIYVYDDEFYKWSDGRSIPEEKKQQILKNFIEAMNFQNIDVEVQ
ncbi:MAG: ATP-binding protein [Legionella sp.]|jgi:hypothetical protein